ncbi:trypsin-like cysteine/serine peptidase domain-containing protein [Tribonema minus]|uniref:Trypsin-like cysteine/serine peptidase domain-containing protein n=1 Tax=Tribonema minus TaxID=303371 RepID=A0A835ZA79_9STRA|nr:trypsin-like cysteine/serine peptidase domain-containing protein [Tribonema minus]
MDSVLDSVVRIYCTHNLPSYSMPWQRLRQDQSTSTGFVIEGRRIITNAHSVEYSTMIQVRKRGSDRKYQARALAVGEECDLAILTVDDDGFWSDCEPMVLGALAELTDDVSVIGYPVGGECISITAGVVSRVEMTVYAQAGMELLSLQIDAAINPGNSGGPVVNDAGEVVGVAFQSLEGDDVENIGYVVPVNVLQHFLEDVRRHGGAYTGFPRLGAGLQFLESPTLRASLRMDDATGMTGVLVSDVDATAPAAAVLRPGDVILSVDGIQVANDGSVPFREGERVALRYYFSQLFRGDAVSVTLLRDGAAATVTAPLCVPGHLCPIHFDGAPPAYAVVGGLVFTVLSEPYLREALEAHRSAFALPHLVALAHFGKRARADEEVVILTQVLAHPANLGYEGMENLHLLKFNGEPVSSLRHLCALVDACGAAGYMRFDFYPDRVVVMDAAQLSRCTAEVCEDNAIPASRSKALPQLPAYEPEEQAAAAAAAAGQ